MDWLKKIKAGVTPRLYHKRVNGSSPRTRIFLEKVRSDNRKTDLSVESEEANDLTKERAATRELGNYLGKKVDLNPCIFYSAWLIFAG